MQIIYKDEYGVSLYWGASSHPANVGDTVIIEDEEYRVKSRIFSPVKDEIIIVMTQGSVRAPVAESNESGRLNQVNAAIMQTNKRIDATEKKNRALNEQLVTVRKHINQRIRQDKKDSE
jgi:septal ring factor EnvC (AmiA/AmiB activator)